MKSLAAELGVLVEASLLMADVRHSEASVHVWESQFRISASTVPEVEPGHQGVQASCRSRISFFMSETMGLFYLGPDNERLPRSAKAERFIKEREGVHM